MDGVGAALACRLENFRDVQVRLRCRRRPDGVGLIRVADVQRRAVRVGLDGDRGDPQFAASADHAHRDLSPIGNENLLEHDSLTSFETECVNRIRKTGSPEPRRRKAPGRCRARGTELPFYLGYIENRVIPKPDGGCSSSPRPCGRRTSPKRKASERALEALGLVSEETLKTSCCSDPS
jgi:hypothetical protein